MNSRASSLKTEGPLFSAQELLNVDKTKVPYHVAIIPDGNRRWASEHKLPIKQGHIAGAESDIAIVQAAKELGIKVLTLYTFSTENWKRSSEEIDQLMQMAEDYIISYQEKLISNNIRFSTIGRLEALPSSLQKAIKETMQKTAGCLEFDVVLALNYGGRDEIVRAISRLLAKQVTPQDITEEAISQNLDTSSWPDPDLIIRTSGENRLSNFLLWQTSYAEIYIDQVTWPDFTPKHLLRAVCDYQRRERRLGGGAFL